jgi:cation diffusion facilitator family transporter
MSGNDIGAYIHAHDYLGASHDDNARRTRWVVLLTAAMMVAEILAGYWTGSMALLADGFHMATHAGALGVAALAYAYAKRHVASARYTFGTGKVGDLAGFASAIVLGLIALGIGVESAVRLAEPTRIAFGQAIWIAILGLLVNLASAALLAGGHRHGHDHHHHHHDGDGHPGHGAGQDNNLRAAYVHVLADALTSVLAILALAGGRYFGWVWLDPAMGIVGAIVIARWSWALVRDTAAVLLDTADQQLVGEIRLCVEGPGDARIADLHVWRIGPEAWAAIVDVIGPVSASAIRERLRPVHEIGHLTVEIR